MTRRRNALPNLVAVVLTPLLTVALITELRAEKPSSGKEVKRVLLIGQGPDGHPWNSHEYMAGQRILASCLQPVKDLQVIVVKADGEWKKGPELLDGADVAVLFVSQGARWIRRDKRRLAAFQRLAKRGGGLVALHWGMGTKDAKNIADFVELFGATHGGPDRKYKVVTATIEIAAPKHPIMRGVKPVTVKEEFYYKLKLRKSGGRLTPLLCVAIDGEKHPVAYAWNRPDGGRSFCFSGCHFHRNWGEESYRRMITQGVLWTAGVSVPDDGLPLTYNKTDLVKPRPKPKKKRR